MFVLPPFHPLFCTLLRKQDPGISDCSWLHTLTGLATPVALTKALGQEIGTAAT